MEKPHVCSPFIENVKACETAIGLVGAQTTGLYGLVRVHMLKEPPL